MFTPKSNPVVPSIVWSVALALSMTALACSKPEPDPVEELLKSIDTESMAEEVVRESIKQWQAEGWWCFEGRATGGDSSEACSLTRLVCDSERTRQAERHGADAFGPCMRPDVVHVILGTCGDGEPDQCWVHVSRTQANCERNLPTARKQHRDVRDICQRMEQPPYPADTATDSRQSR